MSRISVMVKQSWTSAMSMSAGPTPAMAKARSAAMVVAGRPTKVDFSCR
jgi:hypothetical protein